MHTTEDLERKSESREETFNATNDQKFLLTTLKELCDCLCFSLVKHHLKGKTITLKYKNHQFEVKTRSKSINNYIDDSEAVFEIGKSLLLKEMDGNDLKLRLIGIRVSNFIDENEEKNSKQQTKIEDLFKKKQMVSNDNQSTSYQVNDVNDLNDANDVNDMNDVNDDESNEFDTNEEIDGENKSTSNDPNGSNFNGQKESFLCPVCSISRFDELNDLNQHVDYCLSRETIMSSVREFNNSQLVIPTADLDEQASNKRKLTNIKDDNSLKRKKITEYFKKQ